MIERSFKLVLIGCLALAVAACDLVGGESSQSAEEAAAASVRKASANSSLERDLVTAVSPGKPGAPVELKFSVVDRPQVGEPVKIIVQLVPVNELDRLQASFHSGGGVTLQAGATPDPIERPAPGTPITHELTAVADRDGIFYINAMVLADSAHGSLARSFSIPLIVGEGIAAMPAKAPLPTDATGEPIRSLRAAETRTSPH